MKTKIFDKFQILQRQSQNSTNSSENTLVIAAKNCSGERSLSPIKIPTMFKDVDEQLKLAHKVVDVADCPYRKFCLFMLRYNVEKTESS